MSDHTISSQDYYSAWPTLVRLRNSPEVLLVYSGGREGHIDPYGRIELMRTRDLGDNWTYPRVVADGPLDDRDPSITETAHRTLLMSWASSLKYVGKLNEHPNWLRVHERLKDRHSDYAGGRMSRSTDGGYTWSVPYPTLHSPHGPTQLSNGELLYYGKGENGEVLLSRSTDDGISWTTSSFSDVTGVSGGHLSELHAVETETQGRIVLHIRNQPPNRKGDYSFVTQFVSDDYGVTWHTDKQVSEEGEHPSHLVRLFDGRILFTTGRRLVSLGRGIIVRVSEDSGRSWSRPIELATIRNNRGWDLGYPTTVQLPGGGRLLTVWYERPNGAARATLRQKRWKVPQ